MKPLLAGKDLEKTFIRGSGRRYKKTKAVDSITMEVHPGDSVGLIGSSGCGKTTTIRMLMGLVTPDKGKVIRNGRVGFVGQDPYATLAPSWTVGKIVSEPLIFTKAYRNYEQCREEVRRALALVHMDFNTYEGRLPSQLSGGERQRVSIARALILHPDFLVLDEPTSMLDEGVKDKIIDVIREITENGRFGFLLVTHDIAAARRICKYLLVMELGRVVEEGPAAKVFEHPKDELTKNLIAVATDLTGYWKQYRKCTKHPF